MDNSLSEHLTDLYNNPAFPGSLGGLDSFYDHAKKEIPSLTRKQVNEWAKSNNTYSSFKPVRKKFIHPPIKVGRQDYCWEIDLMDVQSDRIFRPQMNRGIRYLFCCIDQFDKHAWVRPIANKTGVSSVLAFKDILESTVRRPKLLRADHGSEFINKSFRNLAIENNIKLFFSNDDPKCAVVERYNRTLKGRIVKYLDSRKTKGDYNYINVLPDIVESINNSKHRIIGMAPNEVNVNNYPIVKKNLRKYWAQQESKLPKSRKKSPRYKVKDYVRIASTNKTFKRGFNKQWTDEIFQISSILMGYSPFAYILKDLGGQIIEGKFYAEQIQAVHFPNLVKIEKILKRQKSNNTQWYLIKCSIYHKPVWITKRQLQEVRIRVKGRVKVNNYISKKDFFIALEPEISDNEKEAKRHREDIIDSDNE